jgi:hypothetical protein
MEKGQCGRLPHDGERYRTIHDPLHSGQTRQPFRTGLHAQRKQRQWIHGRQGWLLHEGTEGLFKQSLRPNCMGNRPRLHYQELQALRHKAISVSAQPLKPPTELGTGASGTFAARWGALSDRGAGSLGGKAGLEREPGGAVSVSAAGNPGRPWTRAHRRLFLPNKRMQLTGPALLSSVIRCPTKEGKEGYSAFHAI